MSAITAEGLTRSFGELTAVDNLTLLYGAAAAFVALFAFSNRDVVS